VLLRTRRDWLSTSAPNSAGPYVPQEGDEVFYFPAGYAAFSEKHPDPREHLRNTSHAFRKVDRGGVACRVARVDFELPARGDDSFDPPVVAAVVTLMAASGSMGGEHEVSMRPSDRADFLVPRRKVMQALNEGYRPGDTVSVRYSEGHSYEGRILTIDDGSNNGGAGGAGPGFSRPQPRPWWEGVTVRWEAGGTGAVSAWELSWPKHVLPLVKQRRLDAGLHEDPAAAWARQAGAERGLLSSEQCTAALASLERVLRQQRDVFVAFMDPVTDEIAPNYSMEIALPIHLGLIQQRLQRKHYRRAEGVFADLRLLETNCRTYNPAGSLIVDQCRAAMNMAEGALRHSLRSSGGVGVPRSAAAAAAAAAGKGSSCGSAAGQPSSSKKKKKSTTSGGSGGGGDRSTGAGGDRGGGGTRHGVFAAPAPAAAAGGSSSGAGGAAARGGGGGGQGGSTFSRAPTFPAPTNAAGNTTSSVGPRPQFKDSTASSRPQFGNNVSGGGGRGTNKRKLAGGADG
ncbi:unnamed protein product, partial [Ectocarpus sp. 12 AP-2014]